MLYSDVHELSQELDQQLQATRQQRLRCHERIRLLILGLGLLMIILCTVFFVFGGTIIPLFATIVVVPLFYWCIDGHLKQSETSSRLT